MTEPTRQQRRLFERRVNAIAAKQPEQLLWLWGNLGVQAYVEDHLECFLCDGPHCSGVEAANQVLALAEEFNIPKEEL